MPIRSMLSIRNLRVPFVWSLLVLAWFLVSGTLAQSQTPASINRMSAYSPNLSIQEPGGITNLGGLSGSVVDKDGAVIPKAKIVLVLSGSGSASGERETLSDNEGQYRFSDVPAGPFEVTISAPGFAAQKLSGTLVPGQNYLVPQVQLAVGTEVDVQVTVTQEQVAEEQIRVQETQRLFGLLPNYYVSYVPDAAPLNPRQKFQLAWKTTFTPVTFGLAAFIAGIEQANNSFSGYGQGVQGYAKRFGASYADIFSGTFIGGAILPTILKQDPRYFYKGTGSKKSRFSYAVANAVICKGDNGRWQPNYSSMLGALASGALSNLYYPATNRNGAGLTFENALIGIGGTAMGGVIQEFFLRKITPHAGDPAKGHN